ncbi:MAG: Xaa-Pro dipeptidyl-peptidase [Limosilactobacillus sp.]|nr:Xaa-Pro dipeptidyl-peptidase [Limosilactobacillus sp.]
MPYYQFAKQSTPISDPVADLKRLRFITDADVNLTDANQLWRHLLQRVAVHTPTAASFETWLGQWLATPTLDLATWFTQTQPVTNSIFTRVSCQLLGFEPERDFDLADPHAFLNTSKLTLPLGDDPLTPAALLTNFFWLLLTRGKNGQTLLDTLTGEGYLAWSYKLPATQKPLLFNGQPTANFNPAHFINEVVYVETDVDTDQDGRADLIKVEITRPLDSNQGLQIPAIFTASPYNQGTNDAWGDELMHNVDQPLPPVNPDYQAPQAPAFAPPTTHQQVNGTREQATETFANTPRYTLNDYLLARGYASVYAAGIGTKDSDGRQTCGSPEQTAAMQAVVEWLHGDRTAFTDRTSGIAIQANWCNGRVAMTGRSYLGTLTTAVATTGVPGLAAIIAEAGITNWYDYYRENGLVMAPDTFQGEDADVLAAETYSTTRNPARALADHVANENYLAQMRQAQDRTTGQYNAFWAARNYHPHLSQIKADVMVVHGLNDWNVKPNHAKALWEALQKLPGDHKLILHQGQHIYINAFPSLDFNEMVNLWLAEKLWQFPNQAGQLLPDLITQSNLTPGVWQPVSTWQAPLIPTALGHQMITINDQQADATATTWRHQPLTWFNALLNDTDHHFSYRVTIPRHASWLAGTPTLTVRVKSNHNVGMLSAYLVDHGTAKRLTTTPQLINRHGLQLGYHWHTDDLRDFKLQSQPTERHVIAFGHTNLQNPTGPTSFHDLQADEWVTITMPLQPVMHELAADHELELILFGTDYRMSFRGNQALTYTIDLSQSSLALPWTNFSLQ